MAEECGLVEPLLSAWLDGELDEAEAGAVEAHVAGCPACEAVLEDCAEVSALLGNLPVRRGPARLVAGPAEAPDPLRPAVRRVQALALATGLLVAAAFALGSGTAVERQGPEPLDAFVADQVGQTFRGHTTLFFRSHPSTGLVVEPHP